METCFKLINREYFELNKNYLEMIKRLKKLLHNKTKKEKETIIDKLRLIRKMIIELTYKIDDFNENPTLIDELHILELKQEKKLMDMVKQITFAT